MIEYIFYSIRNALYNNGFLYKDNEVNFKYIEQLYYIKKQGNIDIAGKLTKDHVMLNTFSKMKVNLAVQVLLQSVASGMRCVAHLTNKFPREAMYTADFANSSTIFLIFLIAKVNLYICIQYNNINIYILGKLLQESIGIISDVHIRQIRNLKNYSCH